jgi:hypothetical protein
MATMTLMREARRLLAQARTQTAGANPLLARLRADPANLMDLAGRPPDPWQQTMLRSHSSRTLMLCSRQAGKSTVAGALALRAALLEAPALVLLLSPSQRQSAELLVKVLDLYRALGRPVPPARPQDNALRLELANGSRIVSLPGKEATVRGYSGVRLLVIDEASRVPDELYRSVRPMLAVSRGTLVCLSTPWGRRGWFHAAWHSAEPWDRVKITAGQCPRISPEFLAEERAVLGDRYFRQEYECSFEDVIDAVFAEADIAAAKVDAPPPLFVG